jgi:putative addiction module CopG family antidote
MPTVEKLSVALTPEMADWVGKAVKSGEYASASEVIRDALRGWKRERKPENERMPASVKRGLKESADGKSVYRGSFAKYVKNKNYFPAVAWSNAFSRSVASGVSPVCRPLRPIMRHRYSFFGQPWAS